MMVGFWGQTLRSLWRDLLDSKYGTTFLFTLPLFCSGFPGSWSASLILSIDKDGKSQSGGPVPRAAPGSWVFTEAEKQM